MEKRNLLAEVYYDNMSEKEANKVLNDYFDNKRNIWLDLLGINLRKEFTALSLWGLTFKCVSKWRYEGWPTKCVLCGRNMDKDINLWQAWPSVRVNGRLKRNAFGHQYKAKCTTDEFDEATTLYSYYEK